MWSLLIGGPILGCTLPGRLRRTLVLHLLVAFVTAGRLVLLVWLGRVRATLHHRFCLWARGRLLVRPHWRIVDEQTTIWSSHNIRRDGATRRKRYCCIPHSGNERTPRSGSCTRRSARRTHGGDGAAAHGLVCYNGAHVAVKSRLCDVIITVCVT